MEAALSVSTAWLMKLQLSGERLDDSEALVVGGDCCAAVVVGDRC